MKCQRCMSDEESTFRVSSDVIQTNVCGDCAAEARRLRLTVRRLEPEHSGAPSRPRRKP
jgi:predicted metal-binding protein